MAEEALTRGPLGDPAGAGPEAERGADRGGLGKLVHDLRHRRRRFRQFAGVVFVVVVTLAGKPRPELLWIGGALAVLGMLVRMWASGYVMKNEVLATVGPYARVRHPLYVGNVLICAGFCAASGLWWSVLLAALVLLVFYPDAIRYEDQKLDRLFPGEWQRWSSETRALIPRLSAYRGNTEPVPWSLARSLMRNGEPLHILFLGACLWFLYRKLGG